MTADARDAQPSDGAAKSAQVVDHLLGLMQDAGLAPHDRLPTERDLAAELGVSRLTVRRAIGLLETQGRVYRVQGAGTFVADDRISKSLELTGFSEDMRSRGMVPGSSRVEISRIAAGAKFGYRLHLPPSAQVVHIFRIRTADGIPMCIENAYFNADLLPEDLTLGPTDSLYALMSSQGLDRQPHHADQRIEATVLSEEDALRLAVPPFSPALMVDRTVFNVRDEPIEFARSMYRADRFSFEVTIQRQAHLQAGSAPRPSASTAQ